MARAGQATRLLAAAGKGDPLAAEKLWRLVYDELRNLARRYLSSEPSACQLETTTLVHEAFLRLVGNDPAHYHNRRYFFAAAARAMRRILIDDARRRGRAKRGGGRAPVSLEDLPAPAMPCSGAGDLPGLDLVALGEALDRLEALDARLAEVVYLRFFAGLGVEDTAELLGVSPRTVEKDWAFARAWLKRELSG